MHINHLLNELSTRGKHAVRAIIGQIHHESANTKTITSVEEFTEWVSLHYLMQTPNCGRKTVKEIERNLRDMGYLLKKR